MYVGSRAGLPIVVTPPPAGAAGTAAPCELVAGGLARGALVRAKGVPENEKENQDRRGGDHSSEATFHLRNMRRSPVATLALGSSRPYDCGLLMVGS
jgi:hypothetical protein